MREGRREKERKEGKSSIPRVKRIAINILIFVFSEGKINPVIHYITFIIKSTLVTNILKT